MAKINLSLSVKVLTVGPDYRNHRGGIGAIIATYSTMFERFKFLPTFRPYNSNISKAFFFVKQIFVLLKTFLIDKEIKIVHIHGSHTGSFYRKLVVFWIAKMLFGKKVIYHLHSSSYDLFYNKSRATTKIMIKYLMTNIDALICLSPWWEKFYASNFKLKYIDIVNNVVDYPKGRASFSDIADQINFLFLGRVGKRKGIFDLLDVIANQKERYKNSIKLYIGGDGEVEKLKTIIKQNSLENIVEYIGWVSGNKKEEYLQKSHVYILPSYNEGLPVSILEAMSYGLPIISTIVGGTPVILENNVNGYIFEPGDKAAIQNAIDGLINDKQLIKQYGDRSYERVQEYLPSTVSQQLEVIYNHLLI